MKKYLKVISFILVICFLFTSCGEKEFSYSDDLDEDGYFKAFKALDYVTVGDLSKIEISASERDAVVEQLLTEYFPTAVEVMDRAIVDGDAFYMAFDGSVDGEKLDGMASTRAAADLSNDGYIPGFLEQCIGHYPGEKFTIQVTFPDPYTNNTELSGKDAEFDIEILSVVDYVKSELTDDFVYTNMYSYYGLSTVDELYDYLKLMQVEDVITENVTVNEIPEALQTWVNNCAAKSNKLYAENYYGMEETTYLQEAYGVETEEEFFEEYKDELESEANSYLILLALCENENMKVTEDDVKAQIEAAGRGDSYDDLITTFGLPYYKQVVMQDKVLDILCDRAEYI